MTLTIYRTDDDGGETVEVHESIAEVHRYVETLIVTYEDDTDAVVQVGGESFTITI